RIGRGAAALCSSRVGPVVVCIAGLKLHALSVARQARPDRRPPVFPHRPSHNGRMDPMNTSELHTVDEDIKRARVRQMKWLALGVLVLMLVVLAFSAALQPSHPGLRYVYAFAEAA